MSHKERILHMVLFELIALVIMTIIATYITANHATAMAGLSLALSLIAMFWNYIYNLSYDAIFGAIRTNRSFSTRVLHGLGFELGLMVFTVPVLMWVFKLGFLKVLAMDISIAIFFVIYAIIFNWFYDIARQYLVSSPNTNKSKCSAL